CPADHTLPWLPSGPAVSSGNASARLARTRSGPVASLMTLSQRRLIFTARAADHHSDSFADRVPLDFAGEPGRPTAVEWRSLRGTVRFPHHLHRPSCRPHGDEESEHPCA